MVNGRGPTRRTILENAVHGALIISPLLAAPRGTGVLGKPCYDSHEPPRGAEGMSHIQPAPSKSMPSYSTEGDFQNEKMQYDVAYLAREDVRTSSGELSGKQEKHNIDLNVRGLQIHYESDVKLVFPFDRKDPYPIVGNSSAGDYDGRNIAMIALAGGHGANNIVAYTTGRPITFTFYQETEIGPFNLPGDDAYKRAISNRVEFVSPYVDKESLPRKGGMKITLGGLDANSSLKETNEDGIEEIFAKEEVFSGLIIGSMLFGKNRVPVIGAGGKVGISHGNQYAKSEDFVLDAYIKRSKLEQPATEFIVVETDAPERNYEPTGKGWYFPSDGRKPWLITDPRLKEFSAHKWINEIKAA